MALVIQVLCHPECCVIQDHSTRAVVSVIVTWGRKKSSAHLGLLVQRDLFTEQTEHYDLRPQVTKVPFEDFDGCLCHLEVHTPGVCGTV